MDINDAVLKLCLHKPDYFLCSYPGKVVIGTVHKLLFSEKQSFIIFRCEYAVFFKALSEICTLLASDPKTKDKNDPKGILVQKSPSLLYFWKYENSCIKFGIEDNYVVTFSEIFTQAEFLDLLQTFKDALIPSLLLTEVEAEVFIQLSKLSLKELSEFQKGSQIISKAIKKLKIESFATFPSTILIKSYLDILIVYHKLDSFGSNDFITNSIKLITS